MHPWHWRCNAKEINVCLALWVRARTSSAVHHEKQVEPPSDTGRCLTMPMSSCRERTYKPHRISLYVVFVMAVWDSVTIYFFILINCMGAIYFPLRQWRWLGVRATLVGADKLLLARSPAGGTRFTRKTMSTRSDAHVWKAHIHACLCDYSCEDISYISTTTSHLSCQIKYSSGFLG